MGDPATMAAIAGGSALAGSVFGQDKATPGYSNQGLAALPPEWQQLYSQLAGQIGQFGQNQDQLKAGDFNQEQLGALNQLAHPDYSSGNIQQILQAYQPLKQGLTNQINQQSGLNERNIQGQFGRTGSKGGLGSGLSRLLGMNQANTANQLQGLEGNFLDKALGMNQQALGNQLNLGNLLYGQQEQNSPAGLLQKYIGLLQGATPNSGQSVGGTPGGPNAIGNFSNLLLGLGSNQFRQSFGPNGSFGQNLGSLFGGGGQNIYGSHTVGPAYNGQLF